MIIPMRAAQLLFLDWLLAGMTAVDAQIGLFQNDWEPAETDDWGDVEAASFTGYSEQALEDWIAAFLNGDNVAESYNPTLTWTLTGGAAQTIYGIYVRTPADVLLYAERNPDGPVTLSLPGDPYSYTPKFKLREIAP